MKFGWKPSVHKDTDPRFQMVHAQAVDISLPEKIDLRKLCPAIYDQGNLGSCTANVTGAMCEMLLKKQGRPTYTPARLALYYWSRQLEGSVADDAGCTIESAMSVMHDKGVPNESLWNYRPAALAVKPWPSVEEDASKHKSSLPMRVDRDLLAIKYILSLGTPIAIGMYVYSDMIGRNVADTGVVPMPRKSTQQVLGGHAVLIVGYFESTRQFIVRNSWGDRWGDYGYFYLPYEYVLDPELSDDFWVADEIV